MPPLNERDPNGRTNSSKNLETISQWVKQNLGYVEKAFCRILIVNNGLSALRLVQGIKALSYQISGGDDANLIRMVAIASDADWVGDKPEDTVKRPEYLKQYGIEIARIEGTRPTDTYQNQEKVLRLAAEYRCDAVAVGWGHLAENVDFARKVRDQGLVFIGPPVEAMRAMGDKIMSKLLMQQANVPMLPWSGSPGYLRNGEDILPGTDLLLDQDQPGNVAQGSSLKELFNRAYRVTGVASWKDAEKIASEIGYPVVIKATAGGGGRGIRFVDKEEDMENSFNSARSEARAAFGNDVLFVEKAAGCGSRHVEEQILADRHGNVVALGERECSIQRHHQKLIEESGDDIPISDATRQRIRQASVAAAKAVGYESAGTVEFLVDTEGNPFFMEMNTRLQVEHIATEILMPGLDLVVEQLKIAMGIPIDKELRERGLDFRMGGHSIAVRLLAENPNAGFSPQSGTITGIDVPLSGPNGPRHYLSHGVNGLVHSFADSQIGHVVALGKTREQARVNVLAFLDQLKFRGILTTTRFTLDLLRDHDYIHGGEIHTDWLSQKIISLTSAHVEDFERTEFALFSMGIIDHIFQKASLREQFNYCLKTGRTIRPTHMVNTSYTRVRYKSGVYEIYVKEVGEDSYLVTLGERTAFVRFWENLPFGAYVLEVGEQSYRIYRTDEAIESHIEISGRTISFQTDLDPTTFRSPLTGTVTEVLSAVGQKVMQGESLLTVEAMKMITALASPFDGVIDEISVKVGDTVETGSILLRFSDEEKIKHDEAGTQIRMTDEALDFWHSIREENDNPALDRFRSLPPGDALDQLCAPLKSIFRGYAYPASIVEVILRECCRIREMVKEKDWISFVSRMITYFHRDERHFADGVDLLEGLRRAGAELDATDPYVIARSHAQLRIKRRILTRLLENLAAMNYSTLGPKLRKLVDLGYNDQYRELVAKAEDLLNLLSLKMEPSEDLEVMMEQILKAEESGDVEEKKRLLSAVMEAPASLMGRLVGYLLTGRSGLKRLAGKLILLRAYRRHPELSCEYERSEEGKRTYIWRFMDRLHGHFRVGVVSLVGPGETIEAVLENLLSRLGEIWTEEPARPVSGDVVELLIIRSPEISNRDELSSLLEAMVNRVFNGITLSRITFVVREKGEAYPSLLTYRISGENGAYSEDLLYRDLHPSLGHLLNMSQLEPFKEYLTKLPSSDMNVHLYHYRKPDPRGIDYPDVENSIYVRTMIRNSDIVMGEDEPTFPAAIEAFKASLGHLRVSYAATGAKTHNNRIYLRFVQPIKLSWVETQRIIMKMQKHLQDYADVDLTRTEIHGWAYSSHSPGESVEVLIVVDNPTGLMLEVTPYIFKNHTFPGESGPTRALIRDDELEDQIRDPTYVPREEAWLRLSDLYGEMGPLDRKRMTRRSRRKVYVYDRLALLESELEKLWSASGVPVPDNILHARELILDSEESLVPVDRPPGRNNLSMVVWRIRIKMPEIPTGRDLVMISGDMTVRGGSVAIREDNTYVAACKLACDEGLPFIYFAEGSGARIGLDRIVSHKLHHDERTDELYLEQEDYRVLKPLVIACPKQTTLSNGSKERDVGGGVRYIVSSIIGGVPGIILDEKEGYLYLNESNYRIHRDRIKAHSIETTVGGKSHKRWVIDSIVKNSPEINQENLSGSARMARSSSVAFHTVPTLVVVTDTCTGIISYNVRLLKRVIQTRESEIILTGYRALNALYGGEKIFSSNRELGGPEIMGPNGVSHSIVQNESEACALVLGWLRGLPDKVGGDLPRILTDDRTDRDVKEELIGAAGLISTPDKDAERPKPYSCIRLAEILFDENSVREEMAQWGRTVRVGRATMGGYSVGFIAVDTGTVKKQIPADPADQDSSAREKLQFGQVWYSDSSFKTAQWIEFMRREGKPLVIMPNWRGFAGGKSELFEEVLKYGAMIVDELSKCVLPVILYIPPFAEIRGGAWVVIDSQINPDHIVFLVDEHATGSVLEPSGMESVPLVEREIRKDMRTNDDMLARLYGERKMHTGQLGRIGEIDNMIESREKELYPDYVKKWIRIFRRHNTAERMLAVGTAHEVVSTGKARERIYRALKEGLEKMKNQV